MDRPITLEFPSSRPHQEFQRHHISSRVFVRIWELKYGVIKDDKVWNESMNACDLEL